METRAFAPLYGPLAPNNTQAKLISSVTVAVPSTAAVSGVLPGATSANGQCQIQIANKTNQWANCQFGEAGNVVASTVTTGYPVAPGGVVVVSVPSGVAAVSVILDAAATGSTSVVFTRGEGL